MRITTRTVLACVFLAAIPALATAAEAPGAKVQNGAIRESDDAPGRPEPGRIYKFVFDMNTPHDMTLGVNPGLRALGELIMEYASHGVDAKHRSIVAVLHGHYAELALTDAGYGRLHVGDRNPALTQMHALEDQGVVFTAPAKELSALGVGRTDIQPGVKPGARAEFVFLNLEAEGYVFDGTKSLISD